MLQNFIIVGEKNSHTLSNQFCGVMSKFGISSFWMFNKFLMGYLEQRKGYVACLKYIDMRTIDVFITIDHRKSVNWHPWCYLLVSLFLRQAGKQVGGASRSIPHALLTDSGSNLLWTTTTATTTMTTKTTTTKAIWQLPTAKTMTKTTTTMTIRPQWRLHKQWSLEFKEMCGGVKIKALRAVLQVYEQDVLGQTVKISWISIRSTVRAKRSRTIFFCTEGGED